MTGATELTKAGQPGPPGIVLSSDGLGMLVGLRYIVTRASEDEEFQVGDRIRLLDNGDISNAAAAGWMPAEDVPSATRGMCVQVDETWVAQRRMELELQLAALHALTLG